MSSAPRCHQPLGRRRDPRFGLHRAPGAEAPTGVADHSSDLCPRREVRVRNSISPQLSLRILETRDYSGCNEISRIARSVVPRVGGFDPFDRIERLHPLGRKCRFGLVRGLGWVLPLGFFDWISRICSQPPVVRFHLVRDVTSLEAGRTHELTVSATSFVSTEDWHRGRKRSHRNSGHAPQSPGGARWLAMAQASWADR